MSSHSPRRYSAMFVFNAIAWTALLTFWLTLRFAHSLNPDGNPTGQDQIWFMLDGIDFAVQEAADTQQTERLISLCAKRAAYAEVLIGSAYKPTPDACKTPSNVH